MKIARIRKLTADERAALDAVPTMSDSEIVLSDVPEVTDWRGPCAAVYIAR
jgi:hypothetical protein